MCYQDHNPHHWNPQLKSIIYISMYLPLSFSLSIYICREQERPQNVRILYDPRSLAIMEFSVSLWDRIIIFLTDGHQPVSVRQRTIHINCSFHSSIALVAEIVYQIYWFLLSFSLFCLCFWNQYLQENAIMNDWNYKWIQLKIHS